MGRINHITHPIHWIKLLEGKSELVENDIVYKMIIGYETDYQYGEIIEFISKENYQNLIYGIYKFKTFPYAELPILIFDENNQLLPLVKGMNTEVDKLNTEQQEYIEEIKNTKKLIKNIY